MSKIEESRYYEKHVFPEESCLYFTEDIFSTIVITSRIKLEIYALMELFLSIVFSQVLYISISIFLFMYLVLIKITFLVFVI